MDGPEGGDDSAHDREEKIAKLKGFLARSMRSEKRKDLRVATLQADLEEKERQLLGMARELELALQDGRDRAARIAELSSEVERLQRANAEYPSVKAQKLKEMLDTSNLLYSELQGKYEALLEESGRRRDVVPTVTRVVSVNEDEYILLKDDGTYEVTPHLPSNIRTLPIAGLPALPPDVPRSDGALKALLLQFFAANGAKQRALIPTIADAAGFSTDQRAAAMRRFQDHFSWLW